MVRPLTCKQPGANCVGRSSCHILQAVWQTIQPRQPQQVVASHRVFVEVCNNHVHFYFTASDLLFAKKAFIFQRFVRAVALSRMLWSLCPSQSQYEVMKKGSVPKGFREATWSFGVHAST